MREKLATSKNYQVLEAATFSLTLTLSRTLVPRWEREPVIKALRAIFPTRLNWEEMEFPIPLGGPGLAAGTLVQTPNNGMKPIEFIVEGDRVRSGVGQGGVRYYTVAKTKKHCYFGPMLQISIDLEYQIKLASNHVCFSYHNSDEPKKNSIVIKAFEWRWKKDSFPLHSILNESQIHDWFNDIDLAEEVAHQLLQSKGNAEIESFAAFVRFQHHRFMPAMDLKVGMYVPVVKGNHVIESEITNITEEQYDGLIYNLAIPEARNFAANGVLVHDSRS